MFFRNKSRNYIHKKYNLKKLRKEISSLPKNIPSLKNLSFGRTSLNASLTVESALVLPIFLYLMAGILMFLNLMGNVGTLINGIQDTAKQMAVYAYAVKNPSENAGKLTGGISAAYAGIQLQKWAEGLKGFHIGYSSFLKGDEKIDLVAAFRVNAEVPLFSFGNPQIIQRGCVRAWTGRDFRQEEAGYSRKENEKNQVYVAENGVVYHRDLQCTHLRLSVRQVSKTVAAHLRNRYGAKYYACSCCRKGTGAVVYITDTGNRYHASKSCSGLKRTVHSADIKDVDNLPPCSKCGG